MTSALTVDRRGVRRALFVVLGLIVLLHIYVQVTDGLNLVGETMGRRLSNVVAADAFPRWFSAFLWLLAAALTWLAARFESTRDWRWRLLALGFVWLSIDEVASLHEALAGPLRTALALEGALYYVWVIPALVVVASLAMAYINLARTLSPSVRRRLIPALVVYVAVGVGLDLFDGPDTALTVVSIIEEFLEMGTMILIVDSLWFLLGSDHLVVRAGEPALPDRSPVPEKERVGH